MQLGVSGSGYDFTAQPTVAKQTTAEPALTTRSGQTLRLVLRGRRLAPGRADLPGAPRSEFAAGRRCVGRSPGDRVRQCRDGLRRRTTVPVRCSRQRSLGTGRRFGRRSTARRSRPSHRPATQSPPRYRHGDVGRGRARLRPQDAQHRDLQRATGPHVAVVRGSRLGDLTTSLTSTPRTIRATLGPLPPVHRRQRPTRATSSRAIRASDLSTFAAWAGDDGVRDVRPADGGAARQTRHLRRRGRILSPNVAGPAAVPSISENNGAFVAAVIAGPACRRCGCARTSTARPVRTSR